MKENKTEGCITERIKRDIVAIKSFKVSTSTRYKYFLTNKENLHHYRKTIGLLYAKTHKDTVIITYSLANDLDEYDHDLAKEICFRRFFNYLTNKKSLPPIPPRIMNDYLKFVRRCKSYFKDKNEIIT